MSNAFRPSPSRAALVLWTAWWRAVQLLRPACRRTTTFFWLTLVLAAFCLRPDLAGVTSLVRSVGLASEARTTFFLCFCGGVVYRLPR